MILRRLMLATAVLFAAAAAEARQVSVPIELDMDFVRRTFVTQVYTDADTTARVWDDGSGCNFLVLASPEITVREQRLHVVSLTRARVGTSFFGKCLTVLDWTGFAEIVEEPKVERGRNVVGFRVVDSHLRGPKGEKQIASGWLWDWLKGDVHPRLATVEIDLNQPFDDVRGLLPLVLPNEDEDRVDTILDSLGLADLRATEGGIGVDLRFDVPPSANALPRPPGEGQGGGAPAERPPPSDPSALPTPEPTLTAEEIVAWETMYDSWDAFLTFLIKSAGDDARAEVLRQELFTILLDGRYDLVEALAPTTVHEGDPVRELFVATWTRLGPVLRNLEKGLPPESALNYIGFIAAADALAALDELGPEVNLEISRDGLRRLARFAAPASSEDPLDYSFDVDPELRRLGGFGPPLESPPPNPDVDTSRAPFRDLLDWLAPDAWAAADPQALARLNRWVPQREELEEYLPLVRDLLKETAEETLTRKDLATPLRETYRWLILATAWQETCWRQFIRQGQTIKPIQSPVGAVGLMQVNQRVWRGLYEVQGLRGDISYNAKAGAEIALHYLVDYVARRGELKAHGNDGAARATYCIYNGGPGAMKRYRNPKASREGKKIDALFLEKYQAVKAGREMEVVSCWGG